MKKILGLDLGVSSIGWALVNEAENEEEKSSIIKIGVRVNPLTINEHQEFEAGKSITTNANRTEKRGIRHNLQRYKLRREQLLRSLKENNFIKDSTLLCEEGPRTTFETYKLRAKAATEKVSLEELARILLMLNKKRGYKSNRKIKSADEGQLIDGMSIAQELYDKKLTPGEFVLSLLQQKKEYIPDFYRSDLQNEFDRIWESQHLFYPDILTPELKELLQGKSKKISQNIFLANHIDIAENKSKDKRRQAYQWRTDALQKQLDIDIIAFVLCDINGNIHSTSGYLGAISDRSKKLYFKKSTIGQWLMNELSQNPHFSLKNQVFYRQDYLDEFDRIWETQSSFHKELTSELKHELRDIIIFYQRPLKSQKGLVSFCEFENKQITINIEGKEKIKNIGCRVCPKSSPLFQEFKIWQILNNLFVIDKNNKYSRPLFQEEKEMLHAELCIKGKLSKTEALKCLYKNTKGLDLNHNEIEGNRTQAALFKAYQDIIAMSGHGEYDFKKMPAADIIIKVSEIFTTLGIRTDILQLHTDLWDEHFMRLPIFQFWHLLYSYEGDHTNTGNESLICKLKERYGFEKEYAQRLANVIFQPDFGNLSSKAMRKILIHLREGVEYSTACLYAGYRHSKRSLTKEELAKKEYKDRLTILPKNSLRNPVVEKILNQMIHIVNTIINTYGKPDEIRIELARELKKNAKERKEISEAIKKTTQEHEKIRKLLTEEFNITHPSRNDIIRYKLYKELECNGYHTLYSNTYIRREDLFGRDSNIDIEHIIPQAKLFDDSFSNKTLEIRSVNIEKGNQTAFDYISNKYGEKGRIEFESRIEYLYNEQAINKTKYNKLLMREADIPEDFLNRDLRDTQYIAKKAREILEELVPFVVSTTGNITDRLREDWQLVNVMQELNWEKYARLGLIEEFEDKNGHRIQRIQNWNKRNDHRHHAMDALTIAFTKRSFIQYLNNLHARSDRSSNIYAIESKELERNQHGKLQFRPPIPINLFRKEARQHLENTLISIKAKNKVTTPNINKIKTQRGFLQKTQLTPRGQLHNATIYGTQKHYTTKEEKVGSKFTKEYITKVANKQYRNALLQRLSEWNNDPKLAFTGKNSLEKNPIYLNETHTRQVPSKVKLVEWKEIFTIRKEISPDLKLEKVVDVGIRQILQKRLQIFGGNAKEAFSNLDENPIWLNQKQGIAIKRVTITGIDKGIALHDKKDHHGKLILNSKGETLPVDFISPSNNHHVAIYRDNEGNLHEKLVSFMEATTLALQNLPVVNKSYNKEQGWTFLFSMKQNEYFIFPDNDFLPNEIDLMNPNNYALISPHLFRVRKFASKDYVFSHHLETSINDINELRDITWKRLQSLKGIDQLVKVRLNILGQIVATGEE